MNETYICFFFVVIQDYDCNIEQKHQRSFDNIRYKKSGLLWLLQD